MYAIVYSVAGIPAPQGSKIRTPYGMRDASKRLKPWRDAVKEASQEQAELTDTVLGGVRVHLTFRFPRPAKPVRDYPPIDIDKLARAVLDGMTQGGIIEDDRHVVHLTATKQYAETPGVLIRIDPN
jgi:Holliday junction resolvase RusA-like endonuclease